MRKLAGYGAVLLLGTAIATGMVAPALAEGETADTVVATVNGTNITLGQVIALGQRLPQQYQSMPDDALFHGIVDQLVQQTALAQSLDGKLTKADEINLENNRTAYLAGNVIQAAAAAAVTDEALQKAYDAKYASVTPGTEYHAAHILVADEAKAKDLKAQIDGGADFAELAKANSSDGSAASGGDLGWFGLGMMVKPFEDAVVKLQPGQVSDPIQTQFGWHIIKLEETRPAAVPSLDEVKAELTSELQNQAVEAKVKEVTDAAKIDKVEGIDPKLLRDQNLISN